VPTRYIAHAKPDAILARLGLHPAGIATATTAELARIANSTSANSTSARTASVRTARAGVPGGVEAEARPGGSAASLPAGRGRVAR